MQPSNDPGTALEVVPQASATRSIYGTDEPALIMERVVRVAEPLARFIRQQHMTTAINGRDYVLSEGWALMGSMLGVFPYTTRVSELRAPDGTWIGFEAHVELRTRDGATVGAAIAECTRDEANWRDRDSFALKSMAATRASGKAFRMSLGFVMKAAGFEATPAEEMVSERDGAPAGRQPGPAPRPMQPRAASSATVAEGVEKRHGVARIDVPTSIPELFQAARYWLAYQADDVALALGADRPSEIAPIIAEHLEGDFLAAFRVVVASLVDAGGVTDWQEPAQEGTDATEAVEAAPVGAK